MVRIGASCGVNILKIKDARNEKCFLLPQGCMMKDFLQNNRKNRPSSSEEYINCGKENLESLLGLFFIKYDSKAKL